MGFEIFKSEKNSKYYFLVKMENGQVLLSSQGYSTKEACEKDLARVRKTGVESAGAKEKANGFLNMESLGGIVVPASELEALDSIQSFALRFLEQSEDLEEEYTTVVDKNFWNLL